MCHFVMVHGSGYGAWCWYKVADLLLKAGHTVSSLDMAGGGIDPRDADTISSLQEYNQPLTDFFTALPSDEKVVLVGHSAGGFNLSFTMERFPDRIAAAVFVTAFMPLSGTTFSDVITELETSETPHITTEMGKKIRPHITRHFLSQNSPSWDLMLWDSLERKFPLWQEPLLYTVKNYGSVKRIYVVAKEDKLLVEAYQRKMIAENPPQMVYEIEGSDHTIVFSKPLHLAEVLIQIAKICV
ncbi:methylesterase 8-like [Cryptomeria japonica]|uniref:methylesterase 8-like n=1 Tax=Cryptomeria japonica TaxID=3369 RepID=UPI0027DAA5EA|nr:methylesterase 8-like [Cryptomeria japonica]